VKHRYYHKRREPARSARFPGEESMVYPIRKHFLFYFGLLLIGLAQMSKAAPPPPMQPPDEKLAATLREKTARLGKEVEALRANTPDWKLADVEVFYKAAIWVDAHNEWYKDYSKYTNAALDRGMERAAALNSGKTPWLSRQGTVFRGYRSGVDGSIQPYQVILPKGYPGDGKKWRLDLILHGRDDTMDEVKFLRSGDSTTPAPEQDYVELHVFGRGNNAYRWAGERDVFEALDAFRAAERNLRGHDPIDSDRIVLRGFSMGGAGAWHLGLQYPGFWVSCSPGAGFTTTYGRVKNPDGKLSDYIVKCLGIYDALDYAENVFDVPVVAYGGEIDPQREASESIKDKITPMGLHATFLVGPKMGHKYDPESLKKIMQLQGEQAAAGRPAYPPRVRYVTMTPRYSDCYWTTLLRQDRQYDRSLVDAERKADGYAIKTENVRTFRLALPEDWRDRSEVSIEIDGQKVAAHPDAAFVLLDKESSHWSQVEEMRWLADAEAKHFKRPGLTGPIDDAFKGSFLCVRGTGKPWHDAVQRHADAELARFSAEWNKWFRGTLPVKTDNDVTPDDLQEKNLILFGDPASNTLIAKALSGLPLHWTMDELTVAGTKYSAAEDIPAMVYPSPFAAGRYVVLNSGHTFHEPDFKNTNRMLYPRYGDWAVLSVSKNGNDAPADTVVTAGLFDEQWQWPAVAPSR
jgi:predicted esterase